MKPRIVTPRCKELREQRERRRVERARAESRNYWGAANPYVGQNAGAIAFNVAKP